MSDSALNHDDSLMSWLSQTTWPPKMIFLQNPDIQSSLGLCPGEVRLRHPTLRLGLHLGIFTYSSQPEATITQPTSSHTFPSKWWAKVFVGIQRDALRQDKEINIHKKEARKIVILKIAPKTKQNKTTPVSRHRSYSSLFTLQETIRSKLPGALAALLTQWIGLWASALYL